MLRQILLVVILLGGAVIGGLAYFRNDILGNSEEATLDLSSLNVLLVVVDTFGEKYRGSAFEGITTTPVLDSLAKEGVEFRNAYAASPWTRPSIASLFTGYVPSVHGITALHQKFNPKLTTMAERFTKTGYATAGFVSHTLLSQKTDFKKGFDKYRIVHFRGDVHESITSDQVTDLGISWLKTHQEEKNAKPFFLFLHYFDPHFNYQDHEELDWTSWYKGSMTPNMNFREFRRRAPTFSEDDVRYARNLYREEIHHTDLHIGRVIDFLKQSGIQKDTLVIITADHGEQFLQHGGVGHGRSMYDEVIKIPLIFWSPSRLPPRVVEQWVSNIDIYPTLFKFQDYIYDEPFRGRSLTPLLKGEAVESKPRTLFSEVEHHASLLAIMKEPYKLIFDNNTEKYQLFDLKLDPDEKKELAESAPEFTTLKAQKDKFFLDLGALPKTKGNFDGEQEEEDEESKKHFTPKEVEQLKSLGYM